ncbi:PREDICTED: lysM and putative peptidoglycan-binding domain-containing protein 2 isoform X1 [Cyphomyrmex costatus]|uniref:LysM and putative peptidoglycan-binding domain-containing protein 2 n=1 Tax=Cyphomyrmex costatus TaxID=456900 RepID=A0A195CJX2_9HYME|nr:PREDICTED: lysM and putative peptidoglycan-binding domain-containing protein 2 isoform X1 [Cyphomyrmex costatus]KYN01026.1 LysM and putative peptidoglycan-binding domain-containing protein 2 [Cyphomyrmex costatus]
MERNGAREMEERRCIRDTGRALKKYGSTAKHITRTESLMKHTVCPTDTLQGIALKYGVTTEQIRRINRLWASDSLFLREHLLIPVSADSPASMCNDESIASEEHDVPPSISSPSSISSSIDDEGSVNDFLAKMDTSIANVKRDVKRTQGNSEFCTDGNDVHVQRRRGSAKLRNSFPTTSNTYSTSSSDSTRPVSSSDMHNFPTAVVMTQGRRVKTSLQRLEQQQDEMFQL